MNFDYSNNLNTVNQGLVNTNFRAGTNMSVNTALLKENNPVDKFVKRVDEEKEKKQNKTAITVVSSVLGLSLLVAVLNPKFSSKMIEKLKTVQVKTKNKIETSKGDFVKSKFYQILEKTTNWISRFVSWTNNINSVKDTYFKQFCTEEKSFLNIYNKRRRKNLQRFDKGILKTLKKPHEKISLWAEKLAAKTVKKSYRIADKRISSLENSLKEYSNRLSPEQKKVFEEKLAEITKNKEFISETDLLKRLEDQSEIMNTLNHNIRNQWKKYKHGFFNKYVKNSEHFNNNLSFWAQDIMSTERERINKAGIDSVEKLFGNNKDIKGGYRELIDMISSSINLEEKLALEKNYAKAGKALKNANKTECIDYFDKKRDLTLGSAPTDILTALIGLTTGGIALAAANNKDDRISRLLTGILPTAAGIGTSIAMTSMLFSGTKGMLIGIGTGGLLSLIGSKINDFRLSLKNNNSTEVNNA